ncbi:MAG TPA: hypothetical protein VH370_09200 [Humisphaera sp.]|jgi:hypothetical protein|nr:hypothetical protein [Humisphaera sp.]
MTDIAANTEAPKLLEASDQSSRRAIVLTILVFAILSTLCSVFSDGFIAADACVHYMYARFCFQEPMRLVDVWGRPLVTALYAIPAVTGGRIAVRAVALLVALGCGLTAMTLGRGQKLRLPALALILTLGQPILFMHSFGEMTELPFALLLGLSALAYQKKQFFIAAIFVALTPLARPEGFGFIAIAGVALLLHRRWFALLMLPLPLLGWDLAGWLMCARAGPWWRWLIDAWPYASHSVYGSGPLLTMVAQLPAIVSPLIVPATIIGTVLSLKKANDESVHLRRCRAMTALIPLFVLVVHSLLYWTGRMASYGEARYLLVAAPFWGVLSARGWEWTFTRLQWRRPLYWAGLAVLVPPILVDMILPIAPTPMAKDWLTARELAKWYEQPAIHGAHPIIMASHPGIFYYMDISPVDQRAMSFTQSSALTAPAGTLIIWDPIYAQLNATANHVVTLDELVKDHWTEISPPAVKGITGPDARHSWHLYVRAAGDIPTQPSGHQDR